MAQPVKFLFANRAAGSKRQRYRHIRENEPTTECGRRSRLTDGQNMRARRGTEWQRRKWFERGYRLVNDVCVGLFLGNLGLGDVRNLVSATGAGLDGSISEEQFTGVKADPFARPEDRITYAVGKVNVADFFEALQTGLAVIEMGKVAANYIVTRRRLA